jgi:hypothetical protein
MTDDQLDAAYTALSCALTDAGAERGELVLARLALLLMHELDDPARIMRAIETARVSASPNRQEESPCSR